MQQLDLDADFRSKGLEAYGAQRVVNSRWLKELEAMVERLIS
jgi:hypothetical protein